MKIREILTEGLKRDEAEDILHSPGAAGSGRERNGRTGRRRHALL